VNDTFTSVKGFFATAKATLFGRYADPQTLRALEEPADEHGALVPLTVGASRSSNEIEHANSSQ